MLLLVLERISGYISQTSGFFSDLEQGCFSSSSPSVLPEKTKRDMNALFHLLLVPPD